MSACEILTDRPRLPPRDAAGHKGTFGTVLVIGGHVSSDAEGPRARTMLGAPALAAKAALRVGAGRVILAVPEPLLAAALTLCPSATGVALPLDRAGRLDASGAAERIDAAREEADALVLGPGLGRGEAEAQIVVRLVARDEQPIILDADALSVLSEVPQFAPDLKAPIVMTPHPGEYRRLARPLDISLDPAVPAERVAAAADMARRLGVIVVLKGPGTVVSNGLGAAVNDSGTAALATGGSGDVLSGVIGGLAAQFAAPRSPAATRLSLFDVARLGVRLHGLAAERWSARHGTAGLLAPELCDELPAMLAEERAR